MWLSASGGPHCGWSALEGSVLKARAGLWPPVSREGGGRSGSVGGYGDVTLCTDRGVP